MARSIQICVKRRRHGSKIQRRRASYDTLKRAGVSSGVVSGWRGQYCTTLLHVLCFFVGSPHPCTPARGTKLER
jgi:hypothetical protein